MAGRDGSLENIMSFNTTDPGSMLFSRGRPGVYDLECNTFRPNGK